MATRAAHVDLAGTLFVVWGLLMTSVGVSMLALGVGGLAVMRAPTGAAGPHFAAGFLAAVFAALALIALAWGLAHVAVGLRLRRLNARARLGALLLGSMDLVLLPYGTALGVYALWVLLQEDAKGLFEPAAG